MRAIVLCCLALAVILAPLPGCDVGTSSPDGGPSDVGIHPPDIWDPGPKPSGPCGYGYGEPCPTPAVDCALSPCVHGTCQRSDGGSDSCICDTGYAGLLCDTCATGYVPEGLACVRSGACDNAPCIFGTCYAEGTGFRCECETGYAGTLCDECAPGYHAENLRCVPD